MSIDHSQNKPFLAGLHKFCTEFSITANANLAVRQTSENKHEEPRPQRNFLQIIWDSMTYKEILEPQVEVSMFSNIDNE